MPHNSSPSRIRNNSFSNNQPRNNFRQSLSAEKAFEKYTSLAKEAMSSGDKTLSENYFQHADHFTRILNEKENNNHLKEVNELDKNKTTTDPKDNSDSKDNKEEDKKIVNN